MGILHRLISFSQPHARVRLTIAVNVTVARDCGAEICFLFSLNFYYRRPWSTGVSLYLHGSEKHILNTTSPPHDALHGLYQYTSDLAFHPYMIP